MNYLKKAGKLIVSFAAWKRSGMPLREPEWRRQLFEQFCSKCDYYDPEGLTPVGHKGKCLECGCHVDPDSEGFLNKLNVPTEGCPLDPPKFVADIDNRGSEPKPITARMGTIKGLHPAEYVKRFPKKGNNDEPDKPDQRPDKPTEQ